MPTSRNGNPTSGNSLGSPSRFTAWFSAARPKTLLVGAAPVFLGTAWAQHYGVFQPLAAVAALLGALLIQVGTNLANDYYDHVRGADPKERVGPTRASAGGRLPPRRVLLAAGACFGLACLVGLYLVYVGGWPILVVGLASIMSGYAYTGGPYPLGYHGWGDLFVFVFFGVVAVAGTYFVQAPTWPVPHGVLIAGAGLGAIATAVLVVNNLRDIDTDRGAGKRTLAVKFGRRFTQSEYIALLAFAYLVPIVPVVQGRVPLWFLLPLVTLPLAAYTSHVVWHYADPRRLNPILGLTGLLTALYAITFGIGVIA